jgi:hypothetical protein
LSEDIYDERTVTNKSTTLRENVTEYKIIFDDSTELSHIKINNIKSAARMSRRTEFIMNANVGTKIKEEELDDLKESNSSD